MWVRHGSHGGRCTAGADRPRARELSWGLGWQKCCGRRGSGASSGRGEYQTGAFGVGKSTAAWLGRALGRGGASPSTPSSTAHGAARRAEQRKDTWRRRGERGRRGGGQMVVVAQAVEVAVALAPTPHGGTSPPHGRRRDHTAPVPAPHGAPVRPSTLLLFRQKRHLASHIISPAMGHVPARAARAVQWSMSYVKLPSERARHVSSNVRPTRRDW